MVRMTVQELIDFDLAFQMQMAVITAEAEAFK